MSCDDINILYIISKGTLALIGLIIGILATIQYRRDYNEWPFEVFLKKWKDPNDKI